MDNDTTVNPMDMKKYSAENYDLKTLDCIEHNLQSSLLPSIAIPSQKKRNLLNGRGAGNETPTLQY